MKILFEGFNLSKKAILFAKAFSYGFNNLKFFNYDFKNSKNKYDIILCIETLEHIPDNEVYNFLKTIYDNLEKTGLLLLTVPTTNLKLHPKHYRHYDIYLLKNQTKSKFHLKEIYFIYNSKSIKTRILKALLFNNLYVLNHTKLRKLLFEYYRSNLRITNKTNAAHIFGVFEKK